MKTKLSSLLFLLFLSFTVLPSQMAYTQCGPGRNLANLNFNDAINNGFSNIGQSFQNNNCSGAIEGVTIRVASVNTPGDVQFKIYAGEVSSTVLTNGTFPITNSNQEIYIPIEPPLPVNFNEYYTFVITETFGDANYFFYNSNGGTEDFFPFGKIWTSPSLEPTNFSQFSGEDDLYFTVHYRDDKAPYENCYNKTIELDISGTKTISPLLLIGSAVDDSGYMNVDVGNAYNGTISDTDDTDIYIPPNTYYYDQYTFTPPVDGTYRVNMNGTSSDGLGFITLLYDALPVPNSGQISNRPEYIGVSGFEDDGTPKTSNQTYTLTGGQTYYIQTSTFNPLQTGTYQSTITLDGEATFTSADIGTFSMPILFSDPNGNTSSCNSLVTIEGGIAPTITCPADITVCEGGIVENSDMPLVNDDKDLPPSELSGFTYLGVNQGKTFYLSDTVALYQVFTLAQSNGGVVATIENQGQNDFLREAVSAQGVDNFMIGYTDRYAEGTYRWQSTSETTYTNWNTGHPNTINEGTDYTEVTPSGKWNSFSYVLFVTQGRYVIEFTGGEELVSGIPFGNVFPEGTTTNTYQVTDTAGNTATCSTQIIVESAGTAPSMVCPENIAVDENVATCSANVTVPQPSMIADNCGSRVIPVSAITPFNLNETGQLLDTSLSLFGLTTTIEDVLLQIDVHKYNGDGSPECFDLRGPDGSQVYLDCNLTGVCDIITNTFTVSQELWNSWINTYGTTLNFSVLANSNFYGERCDSSPFLKDFFRISALNLGDVYLTNDVTNTADASGIYPTGNTIVNWTLTDKSGNISTCEQTITVNDIQTPIISCPDDIVTNNTDGFCNALVFVPKPTITDNCPDVIPLNVGPITPLLFNGNVLTNTPTTLEDVALSRVFDVNITVTFRGDFDNNQECFVLNDPMGDEIFSACGLQSNCEVQNRSFTIDKNVWNNWISIFGFNFTFTLVNNNWVTISSCNEPSGDFFQLTVNTPTVSYSNSFTGDENATGTYPVGITDVVWTATDASGNMAACTQKITVDNPDNSCSVLISPKVYLQGSFINPNINEETLMRDDLRVAGLIPTITPYADALTCNASVFDVVGNDAIVDWVWIELRNETDSNIIEASRSALLQRDGDIVEVDGMSTLILDQTDGSYYMVIKHHNHLGIMTATTISLSNATTIVDFTDGTVATYGTDAQTIFGMPSGVVAMWAGDSDGDGRLSYSGALSDVPTIRSQVFNDPNNSVFGGPPVASYPSQGYNGTDVNMDGVSVYSGASSDVLIIRNNIFNNPSNSVFGGPPTSTFVFTQQLPGGANN